MPKNQVQEGVLPLVEYEQVERYLELIGRQDDLNDIVVAVFPPEPDKPCIHIPVNPSIPSHWGAVERELARHKKHSLGIVVNPAKPQPDDWGDKPEHYTARGTYGSGVHPTTTSATPS